LQRTPNDQARPLGGATDFLPNAKVAAIAPLFVRSRWTHDRHYLPPALPAFRRICSPAYLMPLPLYGSGGRRLRSSAATCPTTSLVAPSLMIWVGTGAVSLMPFGPLYSTACENPSAS